MAQQTIDEILDERMTPEDKAFYKDQLSKVESGEITAAQMVKNVVAAGITLTTELPVPEPVTEAR